MLKTLEEAGEKVDSLVRETFENGKLPNISHEKKLLVKN